MKLFFRESQGQTLIEYGLLLGVLVLVLVVALPGLRDSVLTVFAATSQDFNLVEGEVHPVEDPDPGEDPTEQPWFPPQLDLNDNQTLYTNGDIYLTGSAAVNGNVVTNGSVITRGRSGVEGELTEYAGYPYHFPLPVFPNIVSDSFPNKGNFDAPWWPPVEEAITEDAYYPTFDIKKSVVIDTGAEGEVRTLVIDHLTTGGTGDIYVQGSGKLVIVINETFNFHGDSSFNPTGLPDSAIVYYRGTEDFEFGGAQAFTGNIYLEKANLNLRGSSSNAGNIIVGGDEVTVHGGGGTRLIDSLLYAPLAHVTLTGSADLRGKVVADTVEIQGAAHIDYGPVSVSEDFYWDPFLEGE